MDFNSITQMYIPAVTTVCLIVGYILKKWIKDVDNKWIPTILTILGAFVAVAIKRNFNVDIIIAGLASGLSSTGLHQLFKQFIEKGEKAEKDKGE